jgi:hypothetical protein
MNKIGKRALAPALAALMIVPAHGALATTVTYQNSANVFADASGANDWSGAADVVWNGVSEGTVSGGLFRMTADDGTLIENFVAFCMEFAQFLADGSSYSVTTLSAPGGIDQTRYDYLDALYSNAYAGISDGLTAGAFQFAIWEIMEDGAGAGLDLGGGVFQLTDNGAVATLAGTYLQNLADETWTPSGDYILTQYANPNDQDILRAEIAQAVRTTPPAVPLPGAAWLMLAGLGGLAVVARRRRR